MINAQQIKIPFAGFYQSIHESKIDDAIERDNIEDFSLTDEKMKVYQITRKAPPFRAGMDSV